MSFWIDVLRVIDTKMEVPGLYGWFHWIFLLLTIGATVYLCLCRKGDSAQTVRRVVFWMSAVALLLEVYKQVNYSFGYSDGTITFAYQWYAFPWQFCSTPMYVGVLAGIIKKGKIHETACAYLATFAVFAGLAVMIYPGNVYTVNVGINYQTMICHGSMIPIGAYLLATGHVKLEKKTLLKAVIVFVIAVLLAMVMNEIAYVTGLLEEHNFNMFYISPHCDPSLPVYSLVQQVVPYPWSLIIYVLGFAAAAALVLLAAAGIRSLYRRKTTKIVA